MMFASLVLDLLRTSSAYTIIHFFRRLGVFGLILMGALDSSFLTLPFGNDFLLIGLVSSSRGAIWIVYVVAAAIGSLIGVLIVDVVMRKAGERGLRRFVGEQKVESLKKKLDKGTGWFAFTTAVLPPPFPFTPAIMSASALQASRGKIMLGVLLGRLVRFTIEALLAIYLGRRVLSSFLKSPALDYFVYGLIAIAVIASVVTLFKWFREGQGSEIRGQGTEVRGKLTKKH